MFFVENSEFFVTFGYFPKEKQIMIQNSPMCDHCKCIKNEFLM